jgi:Asp-tRNA(Asn)/Glu-tRNA(Gln) amidotransferase A subunit family amidase
MTNSGVQQLARAVHDGSISAKELVEESLRRIERHDRDLNAVVLVRGEAALAEADGLDETRRNGPLAGVPLLVKDLTDVAGLPTTFGTGLFADAAPAPADATIVARLRAAGAIVVGKTNTPAFGWTAFSDNQVFGATRNPWNLACSPGGSSGGSAAALAAGLAPLATSTDGGGSVRIPAAMCGQVGYKPTIGTIGRDGAARWMGFSTSGATNATVADAVLEMKILAGPTGSDINELPPQSISFDPTVPARVVACRTLRADVDPAVSAAFDATLAIIERDLGVPVTIVPRVFERDDLPFQWFRISSAEFAQSLGWCADRWDELDPGLAAMLRFGTTVNAADYIEAQRLRYDTAATIEALLGADAVLLTPTCNVTSWGPSGPLPSAAGAVTDDPMIAVNTVELNFTGHPGVSVPMGVGPEGVPIGLQIAAPRFGDHLALGLAAALERAQPWAPTAPGYEPFTRQVFDA